MKQKRLVFSMLALILCLALSLLLAACDEDKPVTSQTVEAEIETGKEPIPTITEETKEELTEEDIRAIVLDLLDGREFVFWKLFVGGISMRSDSDDYFEMPFEEGVQSSPFAFNRYEVTDPSFQSVEDVRAAVEKVFAKASAEKMFQYAPAAIGGPEYRWVYQGMNGVTYVETMFKEENGKLFFFIAPHGGTYEGDLQRDSMQIALQAEEEITVTFRVEFDPGIVEEQGMESSSTTATVVIVQEDGQWHLLSYEQETGGIQF